MPTEKTAENGDRKPPQFIKYRLTDEELETAKEIELDPEDLAEFMVDVILERYKFSCSFDNWGGGVQCFLTPGDSENANFGYTLSARAPNLLSAVGLLRFKHINLFSGIWPKEAAPGQGNPWG